MFKVFANQLLLHFFVHIAVLLNEKSAQYTTFEYIIEFCAD